MIHECPILKQQEEATTQTDQPHFNRGDLSLSVTTQKFVNTGEPFSSCWGSEHFHVSKSVDGNHSFCCPLLVSGVDDEVLVLFKSDTNWTFKSESFTSDIHLQDLKSKRCCRYTCSVYENVYFCACMSGCEGLCLYNGWNLQHHVSLLVIVRGWEHIVPAITFIRAHMVMFTKPTQSTLYPADRTKQNTITWMLHNNTLSNWTELNCTPDGSKCGFDCQSANVQIQNDSASCG